MDRTVDGGASGGERGLRKQGIALVQGSALVRGAAALRQLRRRR